MKYQRKPAHFGAVSAVVETMEALESLRAGLSALVRVEESLSDGHVCGEQSLDHVCTLSELARAVRGCSECASFEWSEGTKQALERVQPVVLLASATAYGVDTDTTGGALRQVRTLWTGCVTDDVLRAVEARTNSLIPDTGVLYAVSRVLIEDATHLVQGVHHEEGASLVLLRDDQCGSVVESNDPMFLEHEVSKTELLACREAFFSLLRQGFKAREAWAAARALC